MYKPAVNVQINVAEVEISSNIDTEKWAAWLKYLW